MTDTPACPKCHCEHTYPDGLLVVCPECNYEWDGSATSPATGDGGEGRVWKDANGNILQNGDTVIVIKDLKVKGAPKDLKSGTKVKNIRLIEGDHDIDCKIEGFGAMQLKSEFVRKA